MQQDAKILFPTEFGPLGEKAEENAVHLAKVYEAELILLHAFNIPTGISRLFSDVSETEVRKRAQKVLDDYAQKLRKMGAPKVTTMIRSSNRPEVAIVKSAQELNCGLIVFGTKGGSGLRDTLLGSAVNYVIRNTPCPVLTIRNMPETVGFKKIVVPIDLSTEAGEVVSRSVEAAQRFGSKLHIFSIVSEKNEEFKRLKDRIKWSRQYAREHGVEEVEITYMETEDRHSEATMKFAENIGADLLCCLTQSEDLDLKATLMGSVADQITNRSQIAVLSVNPSKRYGGAMWRSQHFT